MKVIYGAYKEVPKIYYFRDGTYKEYVKFFESELDCARYCLKNDLKYNTLLVTPDSEKEKEALRKSNYNYLSMMGH